jgi:hypothetical protein
LKFFPGLGMKMTVALFHRDGKWQRRRLALTIAVKTTTTLGGNNFNAVFEMLSGPGAFFFFRDLMVFRISEGKLV